MNQKSFVNIILIVLAVVLIGFMGYFVLVKKSEPITQEYSIEPISECVDCVNGETWDNKTCCNANFEKDCIAQNGVVRWSDLHPVFPSLLKGCFQKAPDTGKECVSGNDCLSGVCDLENAIKSNKCIFVRKERLEGRNQSGGGQELYISTYSCNIAKPGMCTETIENRVNPGGASHTFKMDGKILIETLDSGPIF